jgi:type II secretory pathway pseudopilin PulG
MSAGVVVLIIIGALIALVALGLAVGGPRRRERAADLAAEFWDWLKLGR